jgi:DNA-binding NtrC family response regulator
MRKFRILLADGNDDIRAVYQDGLESLGFEVVSAATAIEALRLISTEDFDVLLSDLYMPDACDGYTVVNAMRQTQPNTVTLVLSSYPVLQAAMSAIVLQADQILVKPVGCAEIAEIIQTKLSNPSAHMEMNKEKAAAILERDLDITIQSWMSRVERKELRPSADLPRRTGHLRRS